MTKLSQAMVGALLILSAVPVLSQPVVRSYARGARAPATWRVEPQAKLEIGGRNGSGPTEFSGIAGITLQSDGTLVIADGATSELRIFDSTGRHQRTTTRRGQGPGEIQSMATLASVGDTLVVVDGRRAVHVFTPDGAWLRTLILPAVPGFIVNPVVGALNGTDMVLNLRAGHIDSIATVRADSIWLGRISLRDSSVRVLAAQPLSPSYPLSPGLPPTYPLVFSPQALHAIRAGTVCLAYPARYDITCVDSVGHRTLAIRRDVPVRAVHDAAKNAYRARARRAVARLEPTLRAHRERVLAAAQFAPTFPVFTQMLLARTGELWVRAFVPKDETTPWQFSPEPSQWSIYDPQGSWIADCQLPARFTPADIGATYVVGVSRDVDDIERVTLLVLRR